MRLHGQSSERRSKNRKCCITKKGTLLGTTEERARRGPGLQNRRGGRVPAVKKPGVLGGACRGNPLIRQGEGLLDRVPSLALA